MSAVLKLAEGAILHLIDHAIVNEEKATSAAWLRSLLGMIDSKIKSLEG